MLKYSYRRKEGLPLGRDEMRRGNCYASSEALYHILGGKKAGWKPMRFKFIGPDKRMDTHWFLKHKSGLILDPSVRQYKGIIPPYEEGIGGGFLTKGPSKRARALIKRLTWQ